MNDSIFATDSNYDKAIKFVKGGNLSLSGIYALLAIADELKVMNDFAVLGSPIVRSVK